MTLIEDKKTFYKKTLKIALPLSLQSFLSSAMGLVDMIMVSSIGMVTAVGTAEQISYLSQLVFFGAVSGTGMFASQFFGSKDDLNLKKTFGFSVLIAIINGSFWFLMAQFFGRQILMFYLADESVIVNSLIYLDVVKYAVLISSVSVAFSFIYRAIQLPKVAVTINASSMFLNAFLNWVFIYGKGVPAMGIKGAAIATVIAQVVRLGMYIYISKKSAQPFIGTFKEMFQLNKNFVTPIVKKSIPLFINETMFGVGSTMFIKIFGVFGQQSMDAYYIGNQIYNNFVTVIYGFGGAISVLVGSKLGQGQLELAKTEVKEYMKISLGLAAIIITLMVLFAKPMVYLFSVEDASVFLLATQIISVLSIKAAFRLFNYVSFSILRAGGDTQVIQFLDSGLLWLVGIPLAWVCVVHLKMDNIVLVLLIVQIEQITRMVGAIYRVLTEKWAKNLTQLVKA